MTPLAAAPLPTWAGPASYVAGVLILTALSRGGGGRKR